MIKRILAALVGLSLASLVFARGRFWSVRTNLLRSCDYGHRPVRVCVVVPARNEAETIGRTVTGLLTQKFSGTLHLIVVDDDSEDQTATVAARAADIVGRRDALTVITGMPLAEGWTGKLWAVSQGLKKAQAFSPDYLLLTDADIEHGPLTLSTLVAKAEREQLALTSLMVRLHCRTLPEKIIIPAFVYFFFLLYPPRWIANPQGRTAGAAGGCMLVRPDALARAGGIESIRSEIIDDCALAKAIKRSGGRVWLGLADASSSIRSYESFRELRRMIERTAFNQLNHSMLLLIGTVVGLLLTFVLPVALLVSGSPAATVLATAAIVLMLGSYVPMVLYHGLFPVWSLALPANACFYLWATLQSAWNFHRGRGGQWKGRAQDC
ncbi:MAG TPA: glycosyltransferase [Terriglobia bacterium]|nr:glycosyltransferase [Terriglobia bacterium]